MTTATDVLVKCKSEIAYAELAFEYEGDGADGDLQCIRDLAAEVRTLRRTLSEADDMIVWDETLIADYKSRLALQEPDATLGRVAREGELLK